MPISSAGYKPAVSIGGTYELVQRFIFVPGLDIKVSDTEHGFAVNDTTGNLE
jgi:hypothetical protein